jgi:ribosomal protein S18 acetylase RimI-like enzyme
MIRTAVREDVEAVLALWAAARSGHASTEDTAAAVLHLIEDRPGALLVAEFDGTVAGALIAASDGWRGNMYRLAVAPDRRRAGIARALVTEGERRLRDAGDARVTALVAWDDEAATGLWIAAGYAPDREIGRFVRNLP